MRHICCIFSTQKNAPFTRLRVTFVAYFLEMPPSPGYGSHLLYIFWKCPLHQAMCHIFLYIFWKCPLHQAICHICCILSRNVPFTRRRDIICGWSTDRHCVDYQTTSAATSRRKQPHSSPELTWLRSSVRQEEKEERLSTVNVISKTLQDYCLGVCVISQTLHE